MRLFLLFALTVLFTGCTSSSFLGDPIEPYQDVLDGAPPALVALNKQLERGNFAVYLADSTGWDGVSHPSVRKVQNVERVVIGLRQTEYTQRGLTSRYVATDRVLRITTRKGSGAGKGARIGAAPGIPLIVAGALAGSGCGEGSGFCIPRNALLVAGGASLAVLGALVGAITGSVANPGKEAVVYEAPLDAYLAPER